jgi:hypothetical protein
MSEELSHKEKLVLARLLEANIDEVVARKIAIAQIQECGSSPMSPAQIDIYVPDNGLTQSASEWISDYLEIILDDDSKPPTIECPVCGEVEEGSIRDLGEFILAHRAYHEFEQNVAKMLDFGDDNDGDDDDDEIAEGS